jgi:hypothetical protein
MTEKRRFGVIHFVLENVQDDIETTRFMPDFMELLWGFETAICRVYGPSQLFEGS